MAYDTSQAASVGRGDDSLPTEGGSELKTNRAPALADEIIRVVVADQEIAPILRLAVALDEIGRQSFPTLLEGDEADCNALTAPPNLLTLLEQLTSFPAINDFVFGGTAQSVIEVAAGNWHVPAKADAGAADAGGADSPPPFNNDFLAALASRLYLDLATVQSLREVHSSIELLQLLNRRRLGWLLDEICRLACLEVRKGLGHPTTLEAIAFGASGAVLGRSRLAPGSFQL